MALWFFYEVLTMCRRSLHRHGSSVRYGHLVWKNWLKREDIIYSRVVLSTFTSREDTFPWVIFFVKHILSLLLTKNEPATYFVSTSWLFGLLFYVKVFISIEWVWTVVSLFTCFLLLKISTIMHSLLCYRIRRSNHVEEEDNRRLE